MRHINFPLRPKTHRPMYLMHKYWARKPYNIIKAYIETYTCEGEVVLDPFCGSGVTVAESAFAGRTAVGIDLNPIAIFITKNSIEPVNLELLERMYHKILEPLETEVNALYLLACPKCGNNALITHVIWQNPKTGIPTPQMIWISCEKCDQLILEASEYPELMDQECQREKTLEETLQKKCTNNDLWYPPLRFKYPSGRKFVQLRHSLIHDPRIENLFTPRNLMGLAMIYQAIDNLPAQNKEEQCVKNSLLLAFTSSLGQASKMVWVIKRRKGKKLTKPQVGSWTHHFFWDPTEYFEVNALNCFIERFKKILAGKRDIQTRLGEVQDLDLFSTVHEFRKNHSTRKCFLFQGDVVNVLSHPGTKLPENSVDFIFTDPPYGDSIQYQELSALWNAWLKPDSEVPLQAEIVINRKQEKDVAQYQERLTAAFRECYRVLKEGKFMVITFHNTEFEYRNALIRAIIQAGFRLEHVLFQHPARRSIKSYLHPKRSLPGDYYLRFQKLHETAIPRIIPVSLEFSEQVTILRKTLTEILLSRGEPTSFPCLMNTLDSLLAEQGYLPAITTDAFNEAVYSSEEFKFNPVGKFWFTGDPPKPIIGPSLTIRITEALEELIQELKFPQRAPVLSKMELRELLQRLFLKFQGSLIPDEFQVKDILSTRGLL